MAFRQVYSIQILSLAPALPLNTVVVPDGVRIIVRDVDAVNVSGSTGDQLIFWNAAGGAIFSVRQAHEINGLNWQWQGRQVFNPGENIIFQVVSGTWDIQASGYELTLT